MEPSSQRPRRTAPSRRTPWRARRARPGNRWRKLTIILVLGLLAALATYVDSVLRNRDPLVGRAYVVDGDTLEIDGTRIRLEGIDAPELSQMCLTSPAATWACGRTARDRLKTKTAMGTVRCVRDGFDRYLRTLAVCYAGDTNLNAWLVRDGWALSLRRGTFAAEEDEARRARRGIWAGAFIAPWHWRASDRDAEILGALKPSGSAAKVLLPQD